MRALAIAIGALLAALLFSSAHGHENYEPACCSNKDCFPVADAIVTETSAGFTLNDTGEFVERTSTKVRKPLDEQYHLCRNPHGTLLCIYPKFQGN